MFLKKIYSTVTIVIIMIAVFIFGAVLPFVERIKISSGKYIENKKTLAKMDKEIKSLGLQQEFLKIAKSDLSNFDKVFLKKDQEEIAEFLFVLEETAKKIGVSIEIKSAVSSKEANPSLAFKIFFKGSFPNIVRFLAAVENNLEGSYRLIEIEKLNMQKMVIENELTIECGLDLKVYSE